MGNKEASAIPMIKRSPASCQVVVTKAEGIKQAMLIKKPPIKIFWVPIRSPNRPKSGAAMMVTTPGHGGHDPGHEGDSLPVMHQLADKEGDDRVDGIVGGLD